MEVAHQGRAEAGSRNWKAETRREARRGDGLPGTLAAVLDPRTLAALVLQAVRQVGDGELMPPMADPSLALQPRAMLAMLAYCYANEVYGSWDVEQMMYEDPNFRALCGRDYPDWRRLRRFRRENRAVLRRTLAETFRNACAVGGAPRSAPESGGRGAACQAGAGAGEDWCEAEAEARIERAMFVDLLEAE